MFPLLLSPHGARYPVAHVAYSARQQQPVPVKRGKTQTDCFKGRNTANIKQYVYMPQMHDEVLHMSLTNVQMCICAIALVG